MRKESTTLHTLHLGLHMPMNLSVPSTPDTPNTVIKTEVHDKGVTCGGFLQRGQGLCISICTVAVLEI